MTPGLAFFYGGMVRAKNVLGMLMQNFFAMGLLAVLWVLVGFTLVVGIWLGVLYTVAAVLLGGYLVFLAQRLRVETSRRNAVVLFHYSLAYLALLFVAAAIDPVLL